MRARHGHTVGYRDSPTYRTWRCMRERCSLPSHEQYQHYGARGIRVCERWQTFDLFVADLGSRPLGTTLDRINRDGNYEPGNCRWATPEVQQNNRSNNRILTAEGRTLTLSQWARLRGIRATTIRERLRRGWSAEQAVSKEVRSARVIRVGDVSLTLLEWSRRSGIPLTAIHERLRRGWSTGRAVSEVVR